MLNSTSLVTFPCTLFFCRNTDTKPWIQVNFLRPKLLSGVLTQGHPESQNWVKTYQIFTSIDGINFIPYNNQPGDTTPKTFTGNTDNGTPIRHLFNRNITAQFIRLYPVESNLGSAALRWNVIGCSPDMPKPPVDITGIPTAHPPSEKQGTPSLIQMTGSATKGQSTGTGPQEVTPVPPSQGVPTAQPCKSLYNIKKKYNLKKNSQGIPNAQLFKS